MFLVINGEDYSDLPDDLTVAGLVTHLNLPEKKLAVELNRNVVSKSAYADTRLSEGDRLEIIHFIGGG
ncbi:MAG: sulfur carrier protein ThiS [Maricaulaceae bacterium]